MPVSLIKDYFNGTWRWSLFWVDGSVGFQVSLFILTAFCAVAMLLGFHTRFATIGCWILMASLYNRAPFAVSGADTLLVILLFWGMFLPLDARWSFDASRTSLRQSANITIFSRGTIAILIQIALVYFCTGCFKASIHANPGMLLQNALQWADYNRPVGDWLLQYPTVLGVLSWCTIFFEVLAPWILFSPWKTSRVRLCAIAALMGLHIGIELTLSVALFSYIAVAGLLLFLPTDFWNVLIGILARWRKLVSLSASKSEELKSTRRYTDLPFALNLLCILLLSFVVALNLFSFLERQKLLFKPSAVKRVAELTMLNQKWFMFASLQQRQTRLVAHAVLKNGREVDLLRGDTFVVGPQTIVDQPNHRWVKYFQAIYHSKTPQSFKQQYAQWLFDRWNSQHTEDEQIRKLSLKRLRQMLLEEKDLPHFGTETLAVIRNGNIRIEDTIKWQRPWQKP